MKRARHPFLDVAGPLAIAHRGGAGEAPENTLPAFAAASALGYRYVETDVHLTADGVVVAFHDDRLDRVTDGKGIIADLDIGAVEAADAGYHFTADSGASWPFRGRGISVPRLATLLQELPELRINIDTKSDAVVEPLMDLLAAHDAWSRVCIGSFSDRRLARVRRLGGSLVCTSIGPRWVTVARLASLVGRMPRRSADCIQIPLRQYGVPLVTPRTVAAAHADGLAVHVWTIDSAAEMNHLLDIGVDGIMTDRPRLLHDVFARRDFPLDGSPQKPVSVTSEPNPLN